MAYRTWGRVLLAALGVGLLAGAGQLGFAYGLGVVRFARDFEQSPGQWPAHLAWVAWFAMLAAVAGALAGGWLAAREDLRPTLGTRIAVSVAGGVGALAIAPLAMLPSRVASISSGSPVTIAGLSAVLGALVGVFAAVAVLSQRVAGLNLGAVTVVIWLVALLSVAPSLGPDDPLPEVRLGVLDATWLGDGIAQRLAVIVMPALALAAGAGIGALARWRGLPVIPVAVSGVVGPALLALAYLIAGPGDDADRYQAAPYWGALIAVAAGGLGSVLAAVARQLTAERAAAGPASSGPASRHGDHTAEVFPGHGGSPGPPSARDDEPTRGFDTWGGDKPTSPPTSDDDDRPGGTGSSAFGDERDVPGGGFGSSRARDLSDVERTGPPRVGEGSLFNPPTPIAPPRQPEVVSPPPVPEPTPVRPFDRHPSTGPGDWRTDKTSTFSAAPAPVVPVVPANSPERRDDDFLQRPTSIRPQPPGRIPHQSGEPDGLSPIGLPDQPGGPGAAWPASPDPAVRPGQAGTGRHGGPDRSDDPARIGGAEQTGPAGWSGRSDDSARAGGAEQTGSSGWSGRSDDSARAGGAEQTGPAGWSGRSDDSARAGGAEQTGSSAWSGQSEWSGGPTSPAGRPAAIRRPSSGSDAATAASRGQAPASSGPAAASGEMPDWRLAPPAWTPPPPVTPGVPASGPSARAEAPPAGAAPAKAPEQKRRGLFRRKNKSEPETTPDTGWVEVPASSGATADDQPGTGQEPAGDKSQGGPRGFGFGRLVSGRFGGDDGAAESAGSWADGDTGTPAARPGGASDHDANPRFGSGTAGGEASPRFGNGFDGDASPRFSSGTSDHDASPRFSSAAPGSDASPRFGGTRFDREASSTDSAPSFDRDTSPRFGGTSFDRESSSTDSAASFDRDTSPRFGGTSFDRESSSTDSAASFDRDASSRFGGATSGSDTSPRFGGTSFDRETASRAGTGSFDLGGSDSGAGTQDDGGRRSWADRARAGDDRDSTDAAADSGTPAKAGRKGRSDRHLRSVETGGGRADSDAGSWDIDDPAPVSRGAGAKDDEDAAGTESTPSRGLFRRNRTNSTDAAETRTDQAGDDAPEPARGRRGKSDKPIQERDEEYVDWVTGLGAPEPVNERRRDETPRRSLRSTTRREDD